MGDTWNPEQYHRFRSQRTEPFHDLVDLVEPVPGGRIVDLGCGTGELTAELHRRLGAAETLGIDSSPAMLRQAATLVTDGLHFLEGDLTRLEPDGGWDLVAANASLHWVDDHPGLFARLTGALRPGGQLAVQVPANYRHPSHTVAAEVAREMGADPGRVLRPVETPSRYAELLHDLGFVRQHVRLQVYGHALERTDDVVEWVRGTLLTHYERQLGAERFDDFLATYRGRLLAALGDPNGDRAYFYPFERILIWGRRP